MNEWTTTPPSSPGYYWTWSKTASRVYLLELTAKYDGLYEEISGLSLEDLSAITHWLGPLLVPEAPKMTPNVSPVSSAIALQIMQEALASGKSIEIPALGIVIEPPAASQEQYDA